MLLLQNPHKKPEATEAQRESPEAMQEDDMDELHPHPPPPPPKEGGEVNADEVTAKLVFYYPFETEQCATDTPSMRERC